jgi:hypothetical protein
LGVELKRELIDERDQHVSCRRSNCGIGRSARFGLHVEGVGARATVDGIEGIMDGHVQHGVDTRFVERVVERSYAAAVAATPAFAFNGDGVASNSPSPITQLT